MLDLFLLCVHIKSWENFSKFWSCLFKMASRLELFNLRIPSIREGHFKTFFYIFITKPSFNMFNFDSTFPIHVQEVKKNASQIFDTWNINKFWWHLASCIADWLFEEQGSGEIKFRKHWTMVVKRKIIIVKSLLDPRTRPLLIIGRT